MPDKEDSGEQSSDGEFDEFKATKKVKNTDQRFIMDEYFELVRDKYSFNPRLLELYLH